MQKVTNDLGGDMPQGHINDIRDAWCSLHGMTHDDWYRQPFQPATEGDSWSPLPVDWEAL